MWFFLILAALDDWKNYRVRNSIILGGLGTGFIINVIEYGITGFLSWIGGVIFPVVLLWVLFLIKTIGAGDIKLLSVVGGFLGIHFVFKSIIIAFLIGAIMSVFQMIRQNSLITRLQYLAKYVSHFISTRKIESYYLAERDGRNCVIHFSIAIVISVFIAGRR